ncbi:MAG: phosphoribosylamine--glycine ligase [Chlorobi bacterium]|nr:phosphoribosylamine--glycine ligase [Chlorobiota bacterium]
MSVLILGSGGREHALAWKISQSNKLKKLYCSPGNPGISKYAELISINIENPQEVVELSKKLGIDLVVIGPETPLSLGVADELRKEGILVFGPNKSAARLEWDKSFSKDFMFRNSIPTAKSKTFSSADIDDAIIYLQNHKLPVVIKASGLAAGKGVVIAQSTLEAIYTVKDMLTGSVFGEAGEVVVIEEFMTGEEASIFVITDGDNYVTLASAQDHKRVGDGDTGLNTGGMGAYAPAPIVTQSVLEKIKLDIIEPVIKGMRNEGNIYVGCLYVGLMIEDEIPRVVEFNCRFGDPETQVVLPILDNDLLELFFHAANCSLNPNINVTSTGVAASVAIASIGYPGEYTKGIVITGIEKAEKLGAIVFQAGTKNEKGLLLSNGGRVLNVTAFNKNSDLNIVLETVYNAISEINFEGGFYRKDIGSKGL